MGDDIVTRLRKIAPIHEGRIDHDCIAEAADEIERLRETVQNFLMQAGQDAYDIKRLREELVQAKYGIEDMYKND